MVVERMESMTSETDTLRHQCREAERQEHEAQTKLNVLTSYFKEKEVELQKGLGELETERKKSMNNLESSDRQQKMLELELENKKQLVDDLKKEIERIESDYRKQVSVESDYRKQVSVESDVSVEQIACENAYVRTIGPTATLLGVCYEIVCFLVHCRFLPMKRKRMRIG